MIRFFERAAGTGVLFAAFCAGTGGCVEQGMSLRETPTRNISTYIMSLYEQPTAGAQEQPPRPLRLPIRAAVAQIGEVAPVHGVLEKLSDSPTVFSRVEGIPGIFDGSYAPSASSHQGNRMDYNYTYNSPPPAAPRPSPGEPAVRDEMQRMRRFALSMGMDYLVLVGGTIDTKIDSTAASAADLTIVGAFLVPSKAINAEGRATAALIDLRSNRVVLTAVAESRGSKVAPSVAQSEGETNLLRSIRDDVLSKAAAQLARNCQNQSGMAFGAPQQAPPVTAGNGGGAESSIDALWR